MTHHSWTARRLNKKSTQTPTHTHKHALSDRDRFNDTEVIGANHCLRCLLLGQLHSTTKCSTWRLTVTGSDRTGSSPFSQKCSSLSRKAVSHWVRAQMRDTAPKSARERCRARPHSRPVQQNILLAYMNSQGRRLYLARVTPDQMRGAYLSESWQKVSMFLARDSYCKWHHVQHTGKTHTTLIPTFPILLWPWKKVEDYCWALAVPFVTLTFFYAKFKRSCFMSGQKYSVVNINATNDWTVTYQSWHSNRSWHTCNSTALWPNEVRVDWLYCPNLVWEATRATSPHATRQKTFGHSSLSLLSHCGLILA